MCQPHVVATLVNEVRDHPEWDLEIRLTAAIGMYMVSSGTEAPDLSIRIYQCELSFYINW